MLSDGEREILCEVNGVVVLARSLDGSLVAPEGLEGIAAYFEAKGTPEDLFPTESNELYGKLNEMLSYAFEVRHRADQAAKVVSDAIGLLIRMEERANNEAFKREHADVYAEPPVTPLPCCDGWRAGDGSESHLSDCVRGG